MASEACCSAGPPIPNEYAGTGTVENIGDLPVYGEKAIIVVYDIFGFGVPPTNGNVRRVCDQFAAAGFLVVMPDFYRGNFWPIEKFPPTQELSAEFQTWWGAMCGFENISADVYERVIPYLTSRGVTSIGAHGFCWGGLMACTLAKDPVFKGVSSTHGARLTVELAEASSCPMLLQPSGDDPPVDSILAKLLERGFDKSRAEHFTSMFHGFLAARGDWNVSEQREAAQEAIAMLVQRA